MDNQETDSSLLTKMRDGDVAAFQRLYQRHQGPIYRYALMRCGQSALAADVVQDVFMGLLSKSYRYDAGLGSLQNFLFGVARNLLLKQDQAERRRQSLPGYSDEDGEEVLMSETTELADVIFHQQMTEHVRQAVSVLRPHYRDVIILYELQELSYAEIAVICDIDIGTVRSRLSRARAAILQYSERLGWRPDAAAKTGTQR
ncbi:RNA polymerase subunit sigma-24 [Undibacterium sp. YM2]|uniref:RNA polymerase sigma factor n=1 Tax=Undibacterium sp. YM2 TaxID=2058625 RepID=UPI001331CB03|nr:RNA polymerase sigma factor [Undibacterium sp. YM2]BBB66624.1 RNA polymerase subunit sigma-24 [Undibacterium sp. YM2]